MKKFFKAACLLCCLTTSGIYAQVGMNNNSPNPNAALDLNNTDGTNDKGLLLPKVALTSTDSFTPMTAHVAGMKVYNTFTSAAGANQVTPGEYFNDGTKWVRVSSSSDTGNDWTLGGNTNGVLKEFGTKDAQPIPFITDGTAKMNLSTTGVLGLGGNGDVNPAFELVPPTGFTFKQGRLRLMSNINNSNNAGITISTFSNINDSWGNGLEIVRGRGTHESPEQIQNGDITGTVKWSVYEIPNKLKPLAFINANVLNSTAIVGGGQLTIGTMDGARVILDNRITLGDVTYTRFKDPIQNKTDIFFAGTLGSSYKTVTSISAINPSDKDLTSLYIITGNVTSTTVLDKASVANNGLMLTFVASGGGTSGKVSLKPATGDKIALMGGATTTAATTAATYIKVISNGVDTWYQIP